MKIIIAILGLTISLMANSTVIIQTTNKGGGTIALTDEICDTGGKIAYATHPDLNTLLGCWSSDNTMIHILWEGKNLRSYDFTGWQIMNKLFKGDM